MGLLASKLNKGGMMPTKEALRERIELLESRLRGKVVRVLNLRLGVDYALVDLLIDGVRVLNRRYFYTRFFKASKIRSFR